MNAPYCLVVQENVAVICNDMSSGRNMLEEILYGSLIRTRVSDGSTNSGLS
jgi:hypothetical protein